MLESKGKYQKAANLLYCCVVCDANNEELRSRWGELIAKTNVAEAGTGQSSLELSLLWSIHHESADTPRHPNIHVPDFLRAAEKDARSRNQQGAAV
jgi:hypothetical protein